MNMTNDICLEGFHDRVNIYEEVTGQMLGCDAKRVEEEFGGSIDNIEPSNPDLVAAKNYVEINFLQLLFNMPTKSGMPIYRPVYPTTT
jgi:hypothetical protein